MNTTAREHLEALKKNLLDTSKKMDSIMLRYLGTGGEEDPGFKASEDIADAILGLVQKIQHHLGSKALDR